MNRTVCWLSITACFAFAGFWSLTSTVNSQEASKAGAADNAPPALLKVEAGKVVLETSLKGTVEAEQTSELFIEAKSFAGPFTVKSAVPHGTRVKKGDVVLELDTIKIDQALGDIRLERELADIALKQAKDEFPILEQSLPLNLATSERDKRIADEDFKRYTEIERDHQIKVAEHQLKSQTQWLEYSREELKQLQKMYRDKDLTEETEEIILKRQKNQIEQLEFSLESLKLQQEREKSLDRPRRDQAMKDSLQKQTLAWKKAQSSLPLEFNQKRLALKKQETERVRTDERFTHLEEDRAAMILRAPSDGIVYHGQADRGTWNSASLSSRLKHNGTIQPKEILMTVVSTRPVLLRADVEEKDLHLLKEGLIGQAIPVGFPSLKLVARLKSLSLVPRTAGSFEARIALDIPENVETVLPGMAANVKFVTYRNEAALLVPTPAISHEDGSDASYVYVKTDKGPVKTEIETGKVKGDKTEVLSGLKAGMEILASKP
jgi:HlyD family secretion protein